MCEVIEIFVKIVAGIVLLPVFLAVGIAVAPVLIVVLMAVVACSLLDAIIEA